MTTYEKSNAKRVHADLTRDVTIAAKAMESQLNELLDTLDERDDEIEELKTRVAELEGELAAKETP